MPESLLAMTGWKLVRKQRHLRLFRLDDDKPVEQAHPKQHIENGCLFELTQLQVDERTAWSVGFEAFGSPERLMDNLRLTTEHIFLQMPRRGFSDDNSFGYPRWLQRLE